MVRQIVRTAIVAAVMIAAFAGPARAATINLSLGGNTFDIQWLHPTEPLDAIAHFTANVQSGFIDFTIQVTNNSPAVGSGLQSFGFNIDPSATAIQNFAGTVFVNAGLEQNLPSIDNNIDVCVWAAQNCQGGGQQSNLNGAGAVGTASFRLLGSFGSGATLDTFGAKFQAAFGSFEFEGEQPPPPTSVPEPASMTLAGLGLATVLIGRRRR
jgi:hypothetical protein